MDELAGTALYMSPEVIAGNYGLRTVLSVICGLLVSWLCTLYSGLWFCGSVVTHLFMETINTRSLKSSEKANWFSMAKSGMKSPKKPKI